MSRGAWVVSGLAFGIIGGYVAAYALGQSPEMFWTQTFPGWVGAGIALLGIGVIVMQLSRR